MSESGLDPIQTWLWSKLDDLGIDGVIYSRHVLDLLISSKHALDYHLAEKEKKIFSQFAPGARKRKHKYSRRSSSFSACEEILWKKDIAVACLLSATDSSTCGIGTVNTIQQVIDELHSKLADLRLTPDTKHANSDDEVLFLKDHNFNRVQVQGKKSQLVKSELPKKENYEDAFPSLDPTNGTTAGRVTPPNSIWNKACQENEPKIHSDSNKSPANPPSKSSKSQEKNKLIQRSRNYTAGKLSGRNSQFSSSFSDEDSRDEDCTNSSRKPTHPTTISNRRQIRNGKKLKPFSKIVRLDEQTRDKNSKKFPEQRKPGRFSNQFSRLNHRNGGMQHKSKKDCIKRVENRNRNPSKQKSKFPEPSTKKTASAARDVSSMHTPNYVRTSLKWEQDRGSNSSVETYQDYAHLPSWMETSLTEISDLYSPGERKAETQENSHPMPLTSKWFRDPETGFLTFEPSQSVRDRSGSSLSSSFSPSSQVQCKAEDDVLQELQDKSEDMKSMGLESWMWCPSPSLWVDGQTSPVSRLESVYKQGIFPFVSAEEYVDDISGRIWEEYKTIFLDLQDMKEGDANEAESLTNKECHSSSATNDETDVQKNVWSMLNEKILPYDENSHLLSHRASSPSNKLHVEIANHLHEQPNDIFNFPHASKSIGPASSISSSSLSSQFSTEDAKPVSGHGFDEAIWRYEPNPVGWSDGNDICHGFENIQGGFKFLEDGAFGYPCEKNMPKYSRNSSLKNDRAQDLVQQVRLAGEREPSTWEAYDKKPEESNDDDQRVMNNLVDAMFSDLGFELLYDQQNEFPDDSHSSGVFSRSRHDHSDHMYNMFHMNCNCQAFCVDVRSLFLHSQSQSDSQRKTDLCGDLSIGNLMANPDMAHFSSLLGLDNLLISIANQKEADRSDYLGLSPSRSGNPGLEDGQRRPLLDSITDNEAWKTSLRIGNIWQNISGIRPVNVIYSEKKPLPDPFKLIPSSETHFRPITSSFGSDSDRDSGLASTTLDELTGSLDDHLAQQQLAPKRLELNMDMSNDAEAENQVVGFDIVTKPSFKTAISKLVQDKSLQTSFEMHVQQDISTYQQLYSRPPKANSR